MLYIFRSRASADVLMFGKDAKALLEIAGKDPDEAKGIFTTEQLPAAIQRLEDAANSDRSQVRARRDQLEAEQNEEGLAEDKVSIHLSQRAVPLIAMMKESLAEDTPVTWGV